MNYVILDIETTGGQYNKEGITEIAIYKFDGVETIDQLISLVNPEIPIQPFVVKLTGISNAMLRSAPKFYEIAKRILEICGDAILVAHNASFDYRILQLEFKRLGYPFEMPTLCTVELSKKLLPDLPSYSLGKLCRSLGIPVTDRHRASGDAQATLKLFKLLLSKDVEKKIASALIKSEMVHGFSPKYHHLLEALPSTEGVFYIHNVAGKIIYLAKTNNIYKKVAQLFSGDTKIAKRIQHDVYKVTYEETGNELISFLKERQEIAINKPALNAAQRKSTFTWALYVEKMNDNHLTLTVAKLDGRKKEIKAFKNKQQALAYLGQMVWQHTEAGAERDQEILQFIENEKELLSHVALVLKGRTINEKSALYIENGYIKGYCFFDLNYQLTKNEVLKNILIPLQHSKEAMHSIKYFIENKKEYKIVRF